MQFHFQTVAFVPRTVSQLTRVCASSAVWISIPNAVVGSLLEFRLKPLCQRRKKKRGGDREKTKKELDKERNGSLVMLAAILFRNFLQAPVFNEQLFCFCPFRLLVSFRVVVDFFKNSICSKYRYGCQPGGASPVLHSHNPAVTASPVNLEQALCFTLSTSWSVSSFTAARIQCHMQCDVNLKALKLELHVQSTPKI